MVGNKDQSLMNRLHTGTKGEGSVGGMFPGDDSVCVYITKC